MEKGDRASAQPKSWGTSRDLSWYVRELVAPRGQGIEAFCSSNAGDTESLRTDRRSLPSRSLDLFADCFNGLPTHHTRNFEILRVVLKSGLWKKVSDIFGGVNSCVQLFCSRVGHTRTLADRAGFRNRSFQHSFQRVAEPFSHAVVIR